jgi:hypothetical protein
MKPQRAGQELLSYSCERRPPATAPTHRHRTVTSQRASHQRRDEHRTVTAVPAESPGLTDGPFPCAGHRGIQLRLTRMREPSRRNVIEQPAARTAHILGGRQHGLAFLRGQLGLGSGGQHFGYVISNEVGQPYSPAVLSKMWTAAVAAAGLRHLKLHGGRHTAVTKMLLDGVPVPVVAAWAGHADASVTLRVYAHSQPEALRQAASTFERVIRELMLLLVLKVKRR